MYAIYIYGNIYHQYTPFMLAYIPAPWIRHGISIFVPQEKQKLPPRFPLGLPKYSNLNRSWSDWSMSQAGRSRQISHRKPCGPAFFHVGKSHRIHGLGHLWGKCW